VEAETRALLEPFERTSGENPYEVHRALQDVMDRLVGIFRVEADLQSAIEQLRKLEARAEKVRVEGTRMFNPGWHLARDLKNMLIVSEAIARSALLRKESRGAHSRLDFPSQDASFSQVNHCVTRGASSTACRSSRAWWCWTPFIGSRPIARRISRCDGTARLPSAARAAPR